MTDYDVLTYHRLVGRYNGIVADTTGVFGDPGNYPDLYTVNMSVAIRIDIARAGKLVSRPPELRLTSAVPPRTLLLIPIKANVESGVLRLPGLESGQPDGVNVIAKSDILGLADDEELIATATFGDVTIGGSVYKFDPVSYIVPEVAQADFHAGAVQNITFTGTVTGGTWALVYGPTPTLTMPATATAAAVQAALRAISAIGSTGVTVTGVPGSYTATFNTAVIPRPLPLDKNDNFTGTGLPSVSITDPYTPTTVDLTTVARWVPTP